MQFQTVTDRTRSLSSARYASTFAGVTCSQREQMVETPRLAAGIQGMHRIGRQSHARLTGA